MTAYLETVVDKFIFRVATDRLYSVQGVWAKAEEGCVRIGVTDFLQQRNGDVAFAEVKPQDTSVAAGEEIAVIETIKVNISLPSPLTGTIQSVNPLLQSAPEVINLDPYGDGWLVILAPVDPIREQLSLLDPQTYLEKIKSMAREASGL